MISDDATVAVFASKNADQQLHYAGVQLCDNQFSIVTSGDQSSRITSVSVLHLSVTGCLRLVVAATRGGDSWKASASGVNVRFSRNSSTASRGRWSCLYHLLGLSVCVQGHLVESLKAGGPNPAVAAHTILAAVLVG